MPNEQPGLTFYLIYWAASAVAVLLTSKIIRGFEISGFFTAVFAAMVIALLNTFIWPVLIFLTLPINVLTLGLFTFVVNGIVIKLAAAVLPGFEVKGWWSAIFGAMLFSVLNTVLHLLLT